MYYEVRTTGQQQLLIVGECVYICVSVRELYVLCWHLLNNKHLKSAAPQTPYHTRAPAQPAYTSRKKRIQPSANANLKRFLRCEPMLDASARTCIARESERRDGRLTAVECTKVGECADVCSLGALDCDFCTEMCTNEIMINSHLHVRSLPSTRRGLDLIYAGQRVHVS